MSKTASSIIALASLTFGSVAIADDNGSGISDTETSFAGAIMLQGDIDITFDGHSAGERGDNAIGSDDEEVDSRYAYFVGNTLYAGAEDEHGNTVDGIIEFFWFESSLDRGSDFYVSVIKVRATPNVEDHYNLLESQHPVLTVSATTNIEDEVGGFRWDWSIPFENYGIDSYGEATLTTEYGLSAGGEGSVLAAETIDEDGIKSEGEIQTKGFFNTEYRVTSQFQVTLYNWEVDVHGTPAQVSWDMWLNTRQTRHESAYHEYFLVSQVKVDEPFVMTSLDISAAFEWYDIINRSSGVSVDNLTLFRPEYDDFGTDPTTDTGNLDTGNNDTGINDTGSHEHEHGDDPTGGCGCSSTPSPKVGWLFAAMGAVFMGRRRRA